MDTIEMSLFEALATQGHRYSAKGRALIDALVADLEKAETEPQARHCINLMLQHQFYKLGR